jgi:DNA polymerase III subunit delta'
MEGLRTRGHDAALRAVAGMTRGAAPHAVLLVGPEGVGKTTLAMDLAAGLLCAAEDREARPCGACRGCRLVRSGGHPDLHLLGPDGPGRQVVIGGSGSRARGVRDLIADLALLPVEGGARVAIVGSAHRMNEDAQAALLKTLEEPPAGVTIVLCADAEEPLLPTIRSRCARLRLGPVPIREVEAILATAGIDDPALAARTARIAAGRPGRALAWAADPDALRTRDALARILLDLTEHNPAARLVAVRSAVAEAAAAVPVAADPPHPTRPPGRGQTPRPKAGRSPAPPEPSPTEPAESDDRETEAAGSTRTPASERRRAAEVVVAIWTDVARDVLLATEGIVGSLRDPRLLEETERTAGALDPVAVGRFIDRLGRAGVLLAGNVGPELVMDDLALAWPHPGIVPA